MTCLLPDILRYDSPKKCPTILYAVNLWLKPVSATGTRTRGQFLKESAHGTHPGPLRDPACGVLTWLVGDPGGVPPVPLRCPSGSRSGPLYILQGYTQLLRDEFINVQTINHPANNLVPGQ